MITGGLIFIVIGTLMVLFGWLLPFLLDLGWIFVKLGAALVVLYCAAFLLRLIF